jgi:hypothetical protein
MKKTILNKMGAKLPALIAGAMLLSGGSAMAGQATTNVFSFSGALGAWWLNGWGGQSAASAYDPTTDHTGDGGGSLYLVDDFAGGSQAVNIGWIGGQEWGGSPYDLTQWTNILFYVKWDTANSTLPITSFNASPGDQGWQIFGSTANNGGWITMAQVTIPNAASNGWAPINIPINSAFATIPGVTATYTFGFKKYTGSGPTGTAAMWVDDITFQGSTSVVIPPPSVIPPAPAIPGLNLTALTGPYTREEIQTTNGLDESFLTGTPSYSYTIQNAANAAGGAAFQNHIFLASAPGTESDPDWTEPNVIFMDQELSGTGGYSWTFRYKTNCPNGNNMCYNNGGVTVSLTSGGSGYTSSPTVVFTGGGGTVAGSLAQISGAGVVTNIVVTNSWGFATAPTISFSGGGGSGAAATATVTAAGVGALATLTETNINTGKWTLSVSGGNTFTMTSPSGLTTNVVLDPTVAALFAAPVTAYFGCQSGNTAGTGQSCVLSNITITGTASPINDTFKNDATLNTNIWQAQGDPNAVQLIPAATPYEWVKWTVPATGYSLQSGTSLTSFNDTTPVFQAQFGTVFQALVPRVATGDEFYRLIKRVPYQLQVLLPGMTNAPNTVNGYTGSPTAQSLSGNITTPVTVNMCDATWHIVNSSDTVHISTTDGSATTPLDSGLVNGTLTTSTFSFGSTGSFTVTASDDTTATILTNTSPSVVVGP